MHPFEGNNEDYESSTLGIYTGAHVHERVPTISWVCAFPVNRICHGLWATGATSLYFCIPYTQHRSWNQKQVLNAC